MNTWNYIFETYLGNILEYKIMDFRILYEDLSHKQNWLYWKKVILKASGI